MVRSAAPIHVRLQGADNEHVALDERSLPSNIYDVTSLLTLETAPRTAWRSVACAYLRRGALPSTVEVLKQATADRVDSLLGAAAKEPCSRADLLAALAGAYVMAAVASDPHPSDPEAALRAADDVFSRADLLDSDHPGIWAAKGHAESAKGRPAAARTWFENAHQNGSIAAALGLAALYLNGDRRPPSGASGASGGKAGGAPSGALPPSGTPSKSARVAPDPRRAARILSAALATAPCTATAWTGLGHALLRAGAMVEARHVLRRAVRATAGGPPSDRREALYALARAEAAHSPAPDARGMGRAAAALREAYLACGGHEDPRVLSLLAEWAFLSGDAPGALGFAERAVEALDASDADTGGVPGEKKSLGTDAGVAMDGREDPAKKKKPESGAAGTPGLSPVYVAIRRDVAIGAWSELARAKLHLGDVAAATRAYEHVKKLADEAAREAVPAPAAEKPAGTGTSASAGGSAGAANASLRLAPGSVINPGVYLRLGLLKVASGNREDLPLAQECLEKVLAVYDDRCFVAMRGLGVAIGRSVIDRFPSSRMRGSDKLTRAVGLLKKGIDGDSEGKTDVTAMLVYAALVEELDPGTALAQHKLVVTVLEGKGERVPLHVWNNMCALMARTGNVSEARRIFKEKIGSREEILARKDKSDKPSGNGTHENSRGANGREEGPVDGNGDVQMSDPSGSDAANGKDAVASAEVDDGIDADSAKERILEASPDVLLYNSGRLAEFDRDYDTAGADYEAALHLKPNLPLVKLRLGCLALEHDQNFSDAEETFKKVYNDASLEPNDRAKSSGGISPMRLTAAGLLNKLYAKTKNHKAQQRLLEECRVKSDYLSLAFAQFMHSHLSSLGNPDRRKRFLLDHIAVPLQQALKHHKRNAFAANGVGVFFAENGMIPEAREAFSQAGACSGVAEAARVNLAHTTIAMAKAAVRAENEKATGGRRFTTATVSNARGLCEQAEKLYCDAETIAAQAPRQNKKAIFERLELVLYRANAKFEVGAYRDAADLIQGILRYAPTSAPLWFNLGQVLRECASDRVTKSSKSLDAMMAANAELLACKMAFSKAAQFDRGTVDPITRTKIDRRFLDHHLKFVTQAHRSHGVSLLNARDVHEDKEKRRLEKIKEVEALREKKRMKAMEEEERKKERQARLEKAAEESHQALERREAEIKIQAENEEERLKKLEEDAERARERKAQREREADALAEDGDREGGASKRKRPKKENVSERSSKKPRKSKKSSAVASGNGESSDEYGDDELATMEAKMEAGRDSQTNSKGEAKDTDMRDISDDDGMQGGRSRPRGKNRVAASDSDDDE